MNINNNITEAISSVTVTFTIAELIVLKGLSENINCILNPKPETQMQKTSWFNTQEKLKPCIEKTITLINKITTGIQSLDEASNELFKTNEEPISDTQQLPRISYSDVKTYYEAVRDNNLSQIESTKQKILDKGFTEEQLCKRLLEFKLS